jgi:hypothetical protein
VFRIVTGDRRSPTQRIADGGTLEFFRRVRLGTKTHLTVVGRRHSRAGVDRVDHRRIGDGVFDNAINIRDTVFDLVEVGQCRRHVERVNPRRGVAHPLAQFGGVEIVRLAAVFINEISILGARLIRGARSGIGVRACHAVSVSTRVGARELLHVCARLERYTAYHSWFGGSDK